MSRVLRTPAMFEQIQALPCAEHHLSMLDRHRQLHLRQRGAQMRRHVVETFGVVFVALGVFGREAREVALEVALHRRIGVLLDQQRRGRMAAEQRQQPGARFLAGDEAAGLIGEFDEAAGGALTLRWWMACRMIGETWWVGAVRWMRVAVLAAIRVGCGAPDEAPQARALPDSFARQRRANQSDASACAISSALRGRTTRATSTPSRTITSVGQSLILNVRPSGRPGPSSIFRCLRPLCGVERAGNGRLRALAVAAPVGTEFDDRGAGKRVEFSA